MPSHKEIRPLPYTPDQLFALVADIESYPEFLPWCLAARNRKREQNAAEEIVWSELVVGFKLIRERFSSKVTLAPQRNGRNARIDVEYVDGPLKYLRNHWIFVPHDDGSCEIDFYVEFEFRNRIFEKMIGALFHEAISRMVGAFEKRAGDLYEPLALSTD
ncbi:MAG: ubiquinone-binding protein [Alphaproteobacteria bacterium]|nr:ubiquinone-binding protein [Alphaproteobacteria bacterium]HCP01237.1 ubiquinone-binding protein [Rhodospirillaceae bacterium]